MRAGCIQAGMAGDANGDATGDATLESLEAERAALRAELARAAGRCRGLEQVLDLVRQLQHSLEALGNLIYLCQDEAHVPENVRFYMDWGEQRMAMLDQQMREIAKIARRSASGLDETDGSTLK